MIIRSEWTKIPLSSIVFFIVVQFLLLSVSSSPYYYALCIMRIYIHWIVQIKERVVKWCVPQNRLFDRLLRFLCTSLRVWWLYYHVLQGELYGLLRCVRAKLPYQARRLGVHEYGIPIIKYDHCIAMIKYDVMVLPW